VVSQVLQREPVVVQTPAREIHKVAWCTGGAQSYFEAAIAAGVSTRRYASTQEPLPAAHHPNATSKSAVSRRFVQLSASSWPSGWRGRWASRTWPWS
jgi:hypothetical protein